jgi:hypothetical protein
MTYYEDLVIPPGSLNIGSPSRAFYSSPSINMAIACGGDSPMCVVFWRLRRRPMLLATADEVIE